MARTFRRIYPTRRYRRFRLTRRSRLLRRRLLIRKKIKKFVNKMGYPSYVKMIGMTESKRLLLRRTLLLTASSSTNNKNPATNTFQIVLNPLECPNINRVFGTTEFEGKYDENTESKMKYFGRVFKYDYLRIKNIFISIKPAQNVSTNSGNAQGTDLYNGIDDSPISNVYAYFTYRYPMLSPDDTDDIIKKMYGTNPNVDRIIQEGKLKNTYTWPSNKSMTISINKLMYRVNSEPFKLCTNNPFDITYLKTLSDEKQGVYDPFNFFEVEDNNNDNNNNNNNNYYDDDDENQHDMIRGDNLEEIPDLQSTVKYNLFFGRLVIVSPKNLRFTTEICYDCVLLR